MHGGGLHGRGACVAGACVTGGCMAGGHAWAGGHVWTGGMHGRGHACHAPPQHYEIRSVNARAVRILLECILVTSKILLERKAAHHDVHVGLSF